MSLDPNLIYQILLVAAPLALTFLHQRGFKLPIIESILNFIIGNPTKPADPNATPAPPSPATPATHPVLDSLLAFLRQKLGVTPLASFSAGPDPADPNKLVVSIQTAATK